MVKNIDQRTERECKKYWGLRKSSKENQKLKINKGNERILYSEIFGHFALVKYKIYLSLINQEQRNGKIFM